MARNNATIKGVRVAAAHDGAAELIVELEYESGSTHEVTLDEFAADALMKRCGATTADQLTGNGWEAVRDALEQSWNRFQE